MSADRFDPETRARTMRAVRSRDTGPELVVRRICHAIGARYRLDDPRYPGRPDLVFPRRRKAIFVHGCFWHGHDCPSGAPAPKANADYWAFKIAGNRARDQRTSEALSALGFSALVVWECEIRDQAALTARLQAFLA
jgi:DNA mismatch endonuclease (patch repair protein)